jgi:hypothetical protein
MSLRKSSPKCSPKLAGWPDEFAEKVAQNVAQPIFIAKIYA